MAVGVNRLTARRVATIAKPGYHADGAGLYLQVTAPGTKSWVFRYRFEGRRPEMGLGPLHVVGWPTLASLLMRHGRWYRKVSTLSRSSRGVNRCIFHPTFWDAALSYIQERRSGWSNA